MMQSAHAYLWSGWEYNRQGMPSISLTISVIPTAKKGKLNRRVCRRLGDQPMLIHEAFPKIAGFEPGTTLVIISIAVDPFFFVQN